MIELVVSKEYSKICAKCSKDRSDETFYGGGRWPDSRFYHLEAVPPKSDDDAKVLDRWDALIRRLRRPHLDGGDSAAFSTNLRQLPIGRHQGLIQLLPDLDNWKRQLAFRYVVPNKGRRILDD